MKRFLAFLVLFGLAGFGGLGGCIILDSPDDDICGLRYGACLNNCDKHGLGFSCKRCCERQGGSCKDAGAGNFDACIN